MPRPRQRDKHLPPCVYHRHGAYYLVRRGVWTRLGADLPSALAAYARGITAGPATTLAQLLDATVADAAQRVTPGTLAAYRRAAEVLKATLVEFAPEEVRPRHVAQVLDHYAGHPSTANHIRTVLKLAYDRAVRQGLVDANPVTPIRPAPAAKRTRYLTDAEYRAVWQAAGAPLRAIMDLAYLTGQRIGDVLALREDQITADGIEIDQRKTGKRLLIAWSADLRAAVEAARALHGSHRRLWLLAQRNGRPRSYYGVRDLWDRACERAGVTDARLHDLRAKALTDAKRQGHDAQALAGHATEATTVRYLRGRERDVVEGPAFRNAETKV
jgi:integrase